MAEHRKPTDGNKDKVNLYDNLRSSRNQMPLNRQASFDHAVEQYRQTEILGKKPLGG